MSNETPLDLDATEARAGAATKGPWEIVGGNEWLTGVEVGIGSPDGIRIEDAEFIAAARTDVPELVAEVKRYHRDYVPREQLQRVIDWRDSLAATARSQYLANERLTWERDAAIARAEVAEAKVAVGLALAGRWERQAQVAEEGGDFEIHYSTTRSDSAAMLRTALAGEDA